MELLPDFARLPLDWNILYRGQEIYQTFPCNHRSGRPKKQLILISLMQAHKQLGLVIDPNILGGQIGLTQAEVKRGISKFYIQVVGDSGYESPLDLLPGQAQALRCPDFFLKELQDYVALILARHQQLYELHPQLVASALLVYYLQLRNVSFEVPSVLQALKIAEPERLWTLVQDIRRLDNS